MFRGQMLRRLNIPALLYIIMTTVKHDRCKVHRIAVERALWTFVAHVQLLDKLLNCTTSTNETRCFCFQIKQIWDTFILYFFNIIRIDINKFSGKPTDISAETKTLTTSYKQARMLSKHTLPLYILAMKVFLPRRLEEFQFL